MGLISNLSVKLTANIGEFLSNFGKVEKRLDDVKRKFGKRSLWGEIPDFIKGAGALAGLSAASHAFAEIGEKAAEFSAQLRTGKLNAQELGNELWKMVPVVGNVQRGVDGFVDSLMGGPAQQIAGAKKLGEMLRELDENRRLLEAEQRGGAGEMDRARLQAEKEKRTVGDELDALISDFGIANVDPGVQRARRAAEEIEQLKLRNAKRSEDRRLFNQRGDAQQLRVDIATRRRELGGDKLAAALLKNEQTIRELTAKFSGFFDPGEKNDEALKLLPQLQRVMDREARQKERPRWNPLGGIGPRTSWSPFGDGGKFRQFEPGRFSYGDINRANPAGVFAESILKGGIGDGGGAIRNAGHMNRMIVGNMAAAHDGIVGGMGQLNQNVMGGAAHTQDEILRVLRMMNQNIIRMIGGVPAVVQQMAAVLHTLDLLDPGATFIQDGDSVRELTRVALVKGLTPGPTIYGDAIAVAGIPEPWDEHPNYKDMRAVGFSVTPAESNTSARVTIRYVNTTASRRGGSALEEVQTDKDASGAQITVSHQGIVQTGVLNVLTARPTLIFTRVESATKTDPEALAGIFVGTVNGTAFHGYNPGYWLMEDISFDDDGLGSIANNITYTMRGKLGGWDPEAVWIDQATGEPGVGLVVNVGRKVIAWHGYANWGTLQL